MHHPTDRITHTKAFVTPVVEHWLERELMNWKRITHFSIVGLFVFLVLFFVGFFVVVFGRFFYCFFLFFCFFEGEGGGWLVFSVGNILKY